MARNGVAVLSATSRARSRAMAFSVKSWPTRSDCLWLSAVFKRIDRVFNMNRRYDHRARYTTESESDRYEGSKRSARFDHLSLLSPRLGLEKKIARVIPGRFYFLS